MLTKYTEDQLLKKYNRLSNKSKVDILEDSLSLMADGITTGNEVKFRAMRYLQDGDFWVYDNTCTECGGDATMAFAEGWDGKIKKGEHICFTCAGKRGLKNPFF